MASGLYLEGTNIMFDAQKVGELTIPEGTILHMNVESWMQEGDPITRDELIEQCLNEGYEVGKNEMSDGYEED